MCLCQCVPAHARGDFIGPLNWNVNVVSYLHLTGWALAACLKCGILSGMWSCRNQRQGGVARNCRFRDFPFYVACLIQNPAPFFFHHGGDKDTKTTIVSSAPWKARFDYLCSTSSFAAPSRVTLCIISKIDGARHSHSGRHAGRVEIEISDVSVSFYIIISLTNSCGLQIECIRAAPP